MQLSEQQRVERHLVDAMGRPPAAFDVCPLAHLDSPVAHFFLAIPRNMSHGGELPLVVKDGRVLPGNVETLLGIARGEGLLSGERQATERFVDLFFLLVKVGVGSRDGEVTAEALPDGWRFRVSALNGHTGVRRHFELTVTPVTLSWSEKS